MIVEMWKHKFWGNNVEWLDFDKRRLVGWLEHIPDEGDEIHDRMESGKICRFKITHVKRCHDPYDMFFADVEAIGYVGEPPFEPIERPIERSNAGRFAHLMNRIFGGNK